MPTPDFIHLEHQSYNTVQSHGLVAETDEGYQRAVVEQAHNLRAFLEPSQHTQPLPHPQASPSFQLSQPLGSSWASEGFVATQMKDNKAIACDPTKLQSVKGWTNKIDCPDLKAPHFNRQHSGGASTEDCMTNFLNHLVEEALLLVGKSKIKRIWSLEYCQKPLPGSAEERKPDIILLPNDPLVQDWCHVFTLAEMKQHGVDIDRQEWFDKITKQVNTSWGCQDAHNFVVVLMFMGEVFTFAFFNHRGVVCLDMLSIVDDKEEYLWLVLYLSLADPAHNVK
ncbi:hypothetical protein EDD22DRAFT_848074 [Suillus occidentalis]|nr:hypothetical protein EDD22DRAFT_848074 [Suillus occidentalis]